ncbi:MAG: BspA family leucine-rich repeat surface protein [Muricauda sp.]|nr:BspA family leucine-rich repeat surface protein [Allomuricauda sp.]
MKIRNVFMSLLAIALIWACGKDDGPEPPKNNAPVIAAKTFTVPENIVAGTAIGTVTATDADKDAMTFSISANDNNLFAITKAGVLSLASGKTLSFATKAQHVITVAVSDGEASASSKVTINVTKVDVENQAPVIEPQQFEAIESISNTEVIGTVVATDPEDDTLGFAIAVNDNDLFEIDPLTGELSLAEGMKLNFDAAQEHTITIGVSDGNGVSTADMTIKVIEDLAPTGQSQEFGAQENIPDTEVIGTVVAEDPEGQPLTFSIVTNDGDLFEITADGELSLAEGMALDFEMAEQHIIVVGASDGFKTTNINVTVLVEDVLDTSLPNDPGSFITKWTIQNAAEVITIGTNAGYTNNYFIDWGDGTVEHLTQQNPTHQYITSGSYIVAIKGQFPSINMKETGPANREKLSSIDEWGTVNWKSFAYAFYQCKNMEYNAVDSPNLTNVTSLRSIFEQCDNFNGKIGNWDTSTITDLSYAFKAAYIFNQYIGGWDVSNVTSMEQTFNNAWEFNQDISGWITDNVISMTYIFGGAKAFNQNIGNWHVNNITDMKGMFVSASAFNQDISGWTVDNVTSFSSMFSGATSFNQDISSWNTLQAKTMFKMFNGASSFDQDLGNWKLDKVTNMVSMLDNSGISADNLNATLIGWNNFVETNNTPKVITLGVDNLTACGTEAEAAYLNLWFTHGWTFAGNFVVNQNCN